MKILLILIVLAATADMALSFDYLATTLKNCSEGIPKFPPGEEEVPIDQAYKDCATKYKDDRFCTSVCQLQHEELILCKRWEDGQGYVDYSECEFRSGMIGQHFYTYTATLNGVTADVDPDIWAKYKDEADESSLSIYQVTKKIIDNAHDRLLNCLPQEKLQLEANQINVDDSCHFLNDNQKKQIEDFMSCYESSWAPC